MTWIIWFTIVILTFISIEIFAIVTSKIPTLSRTIVRFCARYPLITFVLGAITGGIAVHLFGWTPAQWY